MAARRERGLLDPNAARGRVAVRPPHLRHRQRRRHRGGRVSAEASSIAGMQQLGNLTLIYDANRISIEDDTDIALAEDVARPLRGLRLARADRRLDQRRHGSTSRTSRRSTPRSSAADAVTDQPSFIVLRTIIAWPAPNAQNTGKAHGSRARRRRGRRHQAGPRLRPGRRPSRCRPASSSTPAGRRARQGAPQAEWDERFDALGDASRRPTPPSSSGCRPARCPTGWDAGAADLRGRRQGRGDPRRPPGKVINAIAALMPELWGGSADLAGSNNTTIEGAPSFLPKDRSTKMWTGDPSPAACSTSASASTPWARS